jgi:serine/threonine protein kinase
MDQAPHDSPPRPPIPSGGLEAGVEIGDFRIERRLGAGGMGVVYQARQISLNRPVALKVLGQALSRKTDVTRFQREAQAAARLRHPAIAQVYFIGQDRHICFLAMELIEGASLRKVLDRLGTTTTADSSLDSIVRDDLAGDPEAVAVRFDQPTEAVAEATQDQSANPQPASEINPYLSPQARELRTTAAYVRRVVEVIRDAAQALAHAHEQGVMHRDIKPDNLLLDRQGKVHLIDFGVARFFDDQSVTYTGQLVGTPLYMSPEQVTGRGAIDARTDLYSLGLVLYELLTLRPPIEATNRENLLRTIVTKPLAPVTWRNSSVKSDLERIIHKATQKDPDQRYQAAGELAADLDRFLAGQAVTAPAYYFRLDEREITAARPGPVVLAAVDFFVSSVFLFLALTSFALMMGVMMIGMPGAGVDGMVFGAILFLLAITILVGGIAIGLGILSARTWARWLGVAFAGLLVLGSVAGLGLLGVAIIAVLQEGFMADLPPDPPQGQGFDGNVQTVPFSPRYMLIGSFLLYAVPLVAGIIIGGTALWGLLCRAAWQWFAFAREIRAEHRRVREEWAA